MNNKTTAILAVAAFILAGAAVAVYAPAEVDADTQLGKVLVEKGDTTPQTVLLKYNESAYSGYSSYTMSITASDESGTSSTPITKTKGEPITSSPATITLADSKGSLSMTVAQVKSGEDTVSGNYDIGFTTDNATVGPYTITVKLVITAFPEEGLKIVLDTFVYSVTVNVTDDMTAVFETIEFTANEDMDQAITLSNSKDSFTYKNYSWYATGLPEGLNIITKDVGGSMVPYISGLAVFDSSLDDGDRGDSKNIYTVKITGRDANGSEVTGTLTLVVNKEHVMSYKITSDASGSVVLSNVGDTWVYKSTDGGNVYLFVENVKLSKVTVIKTVIKDDVSRDEASSSGTYWSIPVDGAGVYTIEMIYDGGYHMAKLYVVPETTGAGAGFIVVGGA